MIERVGSVLNKPRKTMRCCPLNGLSNNKRITKNPLTGVSVISITEYILIFL